MFETFEHVPAYPLVFPIFWGAFALFALVIVRRLKVFTAVHESTPVSTSEVGVRAWGLVKYAFLQNKMFRWTRAGRANRPWLPGTHRACRKASSARCTSPRSRCTSASW